MLKFLEENELDAMLLTSMWWMFFKKKKKKLIIFSFLIKITLSLF